MRGKKLWRTDMSQAQIPKGFILLSRQIMDSEIMYSKPVWFKWWVYLLLKANHDEKRHRGKTFSRGQLHVRSQELIDLATYYIGSRTQCTDDKNSVFRFFNYLRRKGMVRTQKTTVGLIVEIVNYDYFQTGSNYESNNEASNENNTETNIEHETNTTAKKQYRNYINKNEKELKEFKEEKGSGQFNSAKDILTRHQIYKPKGAFDGLSEWQVRSSEIAHRLGVDLSKLGERTFYSWNKTFSDLHESGRLGYAESAFSEVCDSPTPFKSHDHKANTYLKVIRDRLNKN